MKKKSGTKLALAIAIIQHPAVQKAAKQLGEAGLRKAQEWWQARKAPKLVVLEMPKALMKAGLAEKKNPATAKKKKAARKKSPARKTKS